jgi:hypothetical protein
MFVQVAGRPWGRSVGWAGLGHAEPVVTAPEMGEAPRSTMRRASRRGSHAAPTPRRTATTQHPRALGFHAVVRALCDALGITVDTQARKPRSCEWAVTVMMNVTASDGKSYQTTCLSRRSIPLWAAKKLGDELGVRRTDDGDVAVPLRELCDAVGVELPGQLRKLKALHGQP